MASKERRVMHQALPPLGPTVAVKLQQWEAGKHIELELELEVDK
jgi:hypothetical protein